MDRTDAKAAGLVFVVFSLVFVAAYSILAKPPEKIEEINCSIFDGYPIMLEARPFLDDVQAPEQLDFKTRVAYVDDWNKRRASAVSRYDQLLEACRVAIEKQKSGD